MGSLTKKSEGPKKLALLGEYNVTIYNNLAPTIRLHIGARVNAALLTNNIHTWYPPHISTKTVQWFCSNLKKGLNLNEGPNQLIPLGDATDENSKTMTRAFTTYVRPTLEYASVTWSPSQITQIILLEGVQRTFSERLPELANLSYAERISILKLQSLEHRRLICDLIEAYKIIHNLSSLQFHDFFSYPTCNSTRGHPFRLSVPVAKTDARKHFFACRVGPIWNFFTKLCGNGPDSSKF